MNCTKFFRPANRRLAFSLFSGLILVAASACAPVVANRGNMLDEDRLAEVKVGESTKANVQASLGPPTTVGTFDTSNWYYSGKRTETTAFFKPDTVAERTVTIHFDQNGVVDSITDVSPDQQVAVVPESKITPSVGRSMGVVDQIMDSLSHPGLPGSMGNQNRQPGNIRRN